MVAVLLALLIAALLIGVLLITGLLIAGATALLTLILTTRALVVAVLPAPTLPVPLVLTLRLVLCLVLTLRLVLVLATAARAVLATVPFALVLPVPAAPALGGRLTATPSRTLVRLPGFARGLLATRRLLRVGPGGTLRDRGGRGLGGSLGLPAAGGVDHRHQIALALA